MWRTLPSRVAPRRRAASWGTAATVRSYSPARSSANAWARASGGISRTSTRPSSHGNAVTSSWPWRHWKAAERAAGAAVAPVGEVAATAVGALHLRPVGTHRCAPPSSGGRPRQPPAAPSRRARGRPRRDSARPPRGPPPSAARRRGDALAHLGARVPGRLHQRGVQAGAAHAQGEVDALHRRVAATCLVGAPAPSTPPSGAARPAPRPGPARPRAAARPPRPGTADGWTACPRETGARSSASTERPARASATAVAEPGAAAADHYRVEALGHAVQPTSRALGRPWS